MCASLRAWVGMTAVSTCRQLKQHCLGDITREFFSTELHAAMWAVSKKIVQHLRPESLLKLTVHPAERSLLHSSARV